MDASCDFAHQGYRVIRGALAPGVVGTLRPVCEDILAQWRRRDPQTGMPQPAGSDPTCMRHLTHPAYFTHNPAGFGLLMDTIADPRVLDIARSALGQEPLFRCTSLFMNPLRSHADGNWHRDTQFLEADETAERRLIERSGRITDAVQVQIALVPSADLEYVPGSHLRWDTDAEYAIRRAQEGVHCTSNAMPDAQRIALEPGDALIFDPCGLHRGRYHADKPRRSLLLTYTLPSRATFDFFSDQPWCLEPGYLDGLRPATRDFFLRFIDAFRSRWLESRAVVA